MTSSHAVKGSSLLANKLARLTRTTLAIGPVCFLLTACSSTSVDESYPLYTNGSSPLEAGSVVIAKRIPQVTKIEQLPLYGFLPLEPIEASLQEPISQEPAWAEIDSASGSFRVFRGLEQISGPELGDSLQSTSPVEKAKVLTIEENPTWMAPDSYFIERDLPLPPEGDASRFLKGALGEIAIYLDNGQVIHSGPAFEEVTCEITSPEGLRLEESLLREAADHLTAGSKVVLR